MGCVDGLSQRAEALFIVGLFTRQQEAHTLTGSTTQNDGLVFLVQSSWWSSINKLHCRKTNFGRFIHAQNYAFIP